MKKLYVLFLCLFSGITLFAGNISITNNGKPEAVIVLPASAGKAADFAAEELQLWIKEISGATLPIVPPGKNGGVQIVLALNPAGMEKDLDAIGTTDGFAIRTKGKTITIAATRGTGLIRGVHALLFNNTDIIWARPDEKFGTIFTKNPTLVFTQTDLLSVPKFTQRGFQYSNLFIPATELWQVRNNSSFSTYNVVNGKRQSHLFDQFFIFNGHHNIVGYYMPEKKYYDKHPEFYNLINGKRKRPSENGHLQTGLCLSNEECFQEWLKNFMAKVEEHKNDYDVFGVVLEDTFDSCECPGCTAPIKLANDKVITIKDKNYRSTQFFMWLNRIAAELHKRYPDKKIKTNAYYQTEAAPSCDVHPIIQVNFAPIFRDSKYAIDHPKNKESCDKFLAWSKTGTDLCFRDYYGLVAEFPRPMDAIAIADWQFVNSKYNVKRTMSEMINDSNGRTFVHSQGPHIWDQNMPYFWVLSNASWDPYKGVEYYRRIFFQRVYGDAAKEISEYYAILENAWKKSPGVSNWHESPYGSWGKAVVFDPDLENKLRSLLQKAAKKKMHPNARIMLERLTASFERMIKCETAKLQAAYTSKVPEFDPDFKTGAWKETELNSVFTPYIAGTAKVRTEVRMLHDEKNLYVGVRCFDTVSGDKVFAPSAKRDTWPGGNMLEFLIGNARNKRIQLMVNPKGVIMDKLEKESSWEGFFDIPVKYNADGWSVMVTIPFSLLGYDKTPDHIRLNILRYYFITQSNRQTLFWQRYDMPVDAVLAYPTIKLLKKDEKYQKPLTAGEKAMQGKAPETLVYNDPQAWKLASNTIFSDGAFISTGKAEMRGKEIIAIDPEKSYTITLSAKQLAGNKNSTIYICAHPLDGNKRWIPANAVNAVAGTETELLVPLKKGEKFLTVKNAAKWDLKNRGEIHFNAKYDLSDLPNRNTLKTTAKSTSFKDGKWVIELNAPATVDLPVGTVIRQSKAGGYYNLKHISVKDETMYQVTVKGQDLLPEKGKWWPGVRYIQLQILVNWGAGENNHKTEIKNIIFETATTGKKNSKKEFPKMKENIQQLSDLAGKLHLPYAVVAEYVQGSRELQHGKGVFGTPLKIAGKVYDYGFGTHAEGFIKLRFSQPIVRFRAVAGMEDCRFTRHSKHYVCPMKFSIRSAGKELAASEPLTVDDQHFFDLKLPEVTELELHIDIDGKLSNHFANWGNVEAVTAGGEVIKIGRPGIVPKLPIDFEYGGIPAQQWFNAKGVKHTEEEKSGFTLHTYSCDMDGMEMQLRLKAYHDFPVWEWHTAFSNRSSGNSKQLKNVRSTAVTLYPETLPWITPLNVKRLLGSFHMAGGGANSFRDSFIPKTDELPANAVVQSRCINGRSSESFLPVVDVGNDEENFRLVVGWSGQWYSDVRNNASGREISAGMEFLDLYLLAGESIEIPSAFMQYNSSGGNETAVNLWRRFVMAHLTPRVNGKMPALPISAMHWGGMSEKEHLRRLEHLIKMKVPFDIFWIDAGWYAQRSSNDNVDETSDIWRKHVGDWDFNQENYPEEMRNISAAVHRHGKDFLLWFEPERVIRDRNIAKSHPEYLIFIDGENETLLNLGHPEAWQWCFNKLSSIIERNKIDWFREDFNFEPLPYWSKADPQGRTGITEVKFMAGLYKLWSELRKKHPHLKIDNCASGGRRLDPELLRVSYPLAYSDMMCEMEFDADYSLTHINGMARYWPIFGAGLPKRFSEDTYLFRAVMSSTLGSRCLYNSVNDIDNGYPYEWLNKCLAEYKEIQHFFTADFYALLEPKGKAVALWTAFQYDKPEESSGMVLVFRTENSPVIESTVKFKALQPEKSYRVWDMDNTFSPREVTGKELLAKGLTLRMEEPRTARIIRYRQI